MAGFGIAEYKSEPPKGNGIDIRELFHIVEPKAEDPGIYSQGDPDYPNVAIITFDNHNQFGGMWAKQKLDLRQPFTTTMYLYLDRKAGHADGSADGVTFTLHNDPAGLNAIAGAGEGLGVYKGRKWTGEYYNGHPVTVEHGVPLKNSLVVEIDTYWNEGPYVFDPVTPTTAHSAFVLPANKQIINFTDHLFRATIDKVQQWTPFMATWTPSGVGGILSYTFAGNTRSLTIDNVAQTFGGYEVYWGFTGSTGHYTAVQAAAITRLPLQGLLASKSVYDLDGNNIDNGFVLPGEEFKYTLRATVETLNEPIGPIKFSDALPPDLVPMSDEITVTSNRSQPFSILNAGDETNVIAETGITLTAVGDWVEISFNVYVDGGAAAQTVLPNTGIVTADSGLPSAVNTNTTNVTVLTASLAIKQVSFSSRAGRNNSLVKIGDEITYDIIYANSTASELHIIITDVIQTGLTFERASDGGTYDNDSRTVTWNFPAVPADRVGAVQLVVTVNSSALEKVENVAIVQYGSDSRTTDIVINPLAGEDPSKSVSVTSPFGQGGEVVRKGNTIIYEIDYKNEKESPQTMTIVDYLPRGVTYVTSSGGGVYSAANHTVTWTLATVAAGASGSVTLECTVNDMASIKIINYATIQTGTDAPVPTNPVANPLAGTICANIPQVTKCRTTITGQKLWSDNNNISGTRPPTVNIILYRDGEPYKAISLDSVEDTDFSFYCVPISQNSTHTFTYTVDENPVPEGYTRTFQGNSIINTLA